MTPDQHSSACVGPVFVAGQRLDIGQSSGEVDLEYPDGSAVPPGVERASVGAHTSTLGCRVG